MQTAPDDEGANAENVGYTPIYVMGQKHTIPNLIDENLNLYSAYSSTQKKEQFSSKVVLQSFNRSINQVID